MLVTKTVKGRVEKPSNFKLSCLEHEYNGYQQWMIMGIDTGIYSTYKDTKNHKITKIKYREYPMPLLSRLTKIKKQDTKIVDHWLLFRTKLKRGAIWLPVKLYQEIPKNGVLKDSFIVFNHKKGWYEVRLVFEKEIPQNKGYNILAVDLGERVMATVCGSFDNSKPSFYGKNIRGIRRHYSWLRKRLGERKLLKMIKKIGHNEQNKINTILHEISKDIVDLAVENNVGYIFLGNLKGIRQNAKGRRMNRIISNMAHYKITEMIRYKAEWKGIQVILVDEKNSSKLCSQCSSFGKRLSQGLFKCSL